MDLGELLTAPRPAASPVGAFDPRWKLAAAGGATTCTLLVQGLAAAFLALAGAVLLVAWARLPWRWVGARIVMVLPFLVLLALPLPWLARDNGPAWEWAGVRVSAHGTTAALVLTAKALGALVLVLFVLGTTSVDTTLRAARALGVPALLVRLVLLSHRYLFVLGGELARLRVALRVRGFRNRADRHSYRTVGHVAGTLLVRGHERAERVAQAMRCRGFDGRLHALAAFRTTPRDVVLFLAIVVPAIGLVALDWIAR